MITYSLKHKSLFDQDADAYVLFLAEDFSFEKELKHIADEWVPDLEKLLKRYSFTGKAQSSFLAHMCKDKSTKSLILLGIGKQSDRKMESYRRALGSLIRLAEQHYCNKLALQLPEASFFGAKYEDLGQETAVITHMARYYFDDFLAEKKQQNFAITLILDEAHTKEFKEGLDNGVIIADAVNAARRWIDLPSETLTPMELATKARDIATKHDLTFTEFKEQDIIKMGMGGIAAVSKGSERDCHLVILEYRAHKKGVPTLGFVGKGITFDSGGLSLKPAQYMETMKEDMSGAAAVLAAIDALAHLKVPVNIVAVLPISENLPSGNATKPGDIIRFYNGKTAEVRNTDAEGRLILADALSYAEKHYKPDALIDVATLTGACAYALGPFFSGMMSQHKELAQRVQEAADHTGDRVWPLPFDDDYKVAIKSKVADICNIGSPTYRAGAITAGFFLQHFVEKTPWVHLDIAGTAFDVPDVPYYRAGATGAAVRLLVEIARRWQ